MHPKAISVETYSNYFLQWSGELRTHLHSQPSMSHPTKEKVRRRLNLIRIQIHEVIKELPLLPGKATLYVANNEPSVTSYVNQTPAINNMFIGKLINSTRPMSVMSQQKWTV